MSTEETIPTTLDTVEPGNYRMRAARIISNLVSPPMVFAVLGFVLAWSELPFWQGLIWGAIYGFFISLVPIMIVIYMLNTGRVQDLHMSDTRQRRIPYLVSVIGALVIYGLVKWLGGPEVLGVLALTNALGLGILGLVNQYWLISNHMASITSAVLFMGVVFGIVVGLVLSPLIGLVFYARCILRRHTFWQLIAGFVVGAGTVWVVIRIGLL